MSFYILSPLPSTSGGLGTTTAPTAGQIPIGNANGTYTPGPISSAITGTLPTANGGTGLGGATPFTANGVMYASSASVLATGSALTFDGTILTAAGLSGPLSGTVGATTPTTGVFTTAKAIAAATQDSVTLQGRAGGTSSYGVTLTPTTLTASRTLTLPDASGTILQSGTTVTTGQGGTGLTSFNSGGVVYASSTSALATGSALTFDGTNLALGRTALAARILTVQGRACFTASANDSQLAIYSDGSTNGIYSTYNSTGSYLPMTFYINDVEQMRLNGTGLGIGTSSPAAKLVVGSGNTLLGHNTLDNYGGNVDIRSAYQVRAANTPTQLFVANSAGSQTVDTGGAIDFGGYLDSFSRAYSYARIQGLASAGTGYGGYLSLMTLNTGGAVVERMRIEAAGNVGIGTSSPNASALLDVQSTTKGVRMPNMTTTQKNAIASPAAGLMVFDTTLAKLCVYSGSAWQTITSV